MGAFFCEWNNSLINKSVFLDAKFCEELDNAVSDKRKQDEYNSYIENCDLFILLTDSECGNYTVEEFNVAYNCKKHPEIMVFCRESTIPLSENVDRIKELTKERGTFTSYSDYSTQVEQFLWGYIQNYIDEHVIEYRDSDNLKKITFFFGASSGKYEDERNEILRFILGLNGRMLESGFYIQAEPNCVISPPKISILRNYHRSLIDASETAFFLFFTEVDELLEADFRYAVRRFHNISYPKIYTYFYNSIPVCDIGIQRLKNYIDEELNHYYSEFSDVDSIKLSVLIQLSDRYIPDFHVSIENGIISDEKQKRKYLDVNRLCIFSECDALLDLKRELELLTQQYDEVAEQFASDPKRRDLISKLSDMNDALGLVTEKIHKEEVATLNMLFEMHRSIAKGDINQLYKRAYRCLELGQVKEASTILNKKAVDDIYGDYLKTKISSLQDECADAIQMYNHSIRIQRMLGESEETINAIISCYEEIMKYVEYLQDGGVDLVLDYAEFLDEQGIKTAESIFKKAEYLAANPAHITKKITYARMYKLIGTFYLKQYAPSMAEKYLKLYLDTVRELFQLDSDAYIFDYADACSKYCQVETKKKSRYIEEGLEALLKMQNKRANSSEYMLALARYYYERGSFYQRNNPEKEIESYIQAKDILEKTNISIHLLADVYNNLAEAIKERDSKRESGSIVNYYYDLAIEILRNDYSSEPDRYAEILGDLYNNKADFYIQYFENYYQAAQMLKECEKVYLYLYGKNPIRGGPGLAECYIQMANVYESLENIQRAISCSEKGISLLEQLVVINRERYAMRLAWAYNETGLMYLILHEKKKASGISTAMAYLRKCLDTLEDTENTFIQHKQANFIMEMFTGLSLRFMDGSEATEDDFVIIDRIFRFLYKYMWVDMKSQASFVDIMYKMGEKLLAFNDTKDHEATMAFYYPVMIEICEQRLTDNTLTSDDKMAIYVHLAGLVGLMGDVEKGQKYLDQSVYAFLQPKMIKEHMEFKVVSGKVSATKKTKKKKKNR